MSDRCTSCRPVDRDVNVVGIADNGLRTREEMIRFFRTYYEQQRDEAELALSLTDDELVVETYLGPIVMRNRRVVT